MKSKYITQLLSALLLMISLTACSNPSAPLKWTEDVLLPDGRTVKLTRYQEFKGPHEFGDTPTDSDYWFEFKHPDTGEKVRWESDRDLSALALMMEGKIPVLLTSPNFVSSMHRYNCPNPPYLLYRYVAGQWQQVDIHNIPVKRVQVNMTPHPRERRELIIKSKHHLTVSQTQDIQDNYRPYVIDFNLMKEQTFKMENCSKFRDYLIEK